jgi:predicted secreted protein
MRNFAVLLLAVSLAAPALAADDPAAAKPEKPKKEKRICKNLATSESRLHNMVCKTAAEWEAQGEDPAASTRTRTFKPQ